MKHRIVTAAQMKEIERAGDAHGLSYLQMMENAGLAAYAELQKQFPHPGRLLVVCGKGNNGGDGFVIARAAAKDGWNVTVLLAESEPKTADAIRNFERLHSLPVHICADGSVLEPPCFDAAVDALYGTGFHRDGRPTHTFRSYTAFFSGETLCVEDMTIENDAGSGAKAGQAVAAYVDSTRAVFRRVKLLGSQDTLFCAPLPEKEREKDGFLGPRGLAPRKQIGRAHV